MKDAILTRANLFRAAIGGGVGGLWDNTTCPDGTNSDQRLRGTCRSLLPVYTEHCNSRGPGTNLHSCTISDSKTNVSDLRFANLSGATLLIGLLDVNWTGANLNDADLAGVDMTGPNLTGSSLREARLLRVKLQDADLRGATQNNRRC